LTFERAALASVIVINYNGTTVIARCLDRLMAQTYPSFEIIVVDNGSQDGNLAIVEEYKGIRPVACRVAFFVRWYWRWPNA
jgi:glycosyltransferase involved in cell wall biosynthesis